MTEHRPHTGADLMFSLDASRTAPLYQQLSDCIRRQVLAVNWPADSAIPSERELMGLTRFEPDDRAPGNRFAHPRGSSDQGPRARHVHRAGAC